LNCKIAACYADDKGNAINAEKGGNYFHSGSILRWHSLHFIPLPSPITHRTLTNTKGGITMHLLWSLIVGAIIGAIAGAITSKGQSMGWIANIVAGLVGSFIGQSLFGTWGPQLAGMALIPSIIGAVILVAIISLIMGRSHAH
jgi:uncharacterized membrane protein YeaQ/YmgE (transglycosylase-associated protein family)